MRILSAAAFAACLAALPASAFDLGAMTNDERAAFRAEIRAYLLDNPEVLMEAIGVLEDRQAAAQAADDVALVRANAEALFDDANSWVTGNPEGDITIVEFVDYRCGYCRKAHPEVQELVATDGNIRLVIKEFPILGEQSDLSSRFAIATRLVAGDEAYGQAHEELITMRGNATADSLRRLADQLGLDADAIFAKMEGPEVDQVIIANRALAKRLQISGTPTFVVQDQLLRGYLPLENMRELVSETRAEG